MILQIEYNIEEMHIHINKVISMSIIACVVSY